jgi:hypothetical protein
MKVNQPNQILDNVKEIVADLFLRHDIRKKRYEFEENRTCDCYVAVTENFWSFFTELFKQLNDCSKNFWMTSCKDHCSSEDIVNFESMENCVLTFTNLKEFDDVRHDFFFVFFHSIKHWIYV